MPAPRSPHTSVRHLVAPRGLLHRPHARVLLLAFLAATVLSGCVLSGLLQSGWAAAVSIAALLALAACSSSSGGGGGGGGGGDDDDVPLEPIVWPASVSIGDLTAASGFVLQGPHLSAGKSVSSGQDVTGDDIDDLIVGSPYAYEAGRAYVVFGGDNIGEALFSEGAPTALEDIDSADFGVIYEPGSGGDYYVGYSVHIAPDANGDDIGDILIGVPSAGDDGASDRGTAWLIFGGDSLFSTGLQFGAEALSDTGAREIYVANSYSASNPTHFTGSALTGGDFNGDGLSDIAVGSPNTDSVTGGNFAMPRASIVFGASPFQDDTEGNGGTFIDNSLDAGTGAHFGDVLTGSPANSLYNSNFGLALAAGDIDGDGADDLIAGADAGLYGTDGGDYSGAAILFGEDALEHTYANEMGGTDGFRLLGGAANAGGDRVAFLGDINGDGKGDIAVTDDSVGSTGRVYVVFGRAKSSDPVIDMTTELDGSNGFILDVPLNFFDPRVAGGADLNDDGLADLIVSANAEGGQLVAAHVIFGAEDIGSSGTIDLDDLELDGTNGFTVEFAASLDDHPESFAFGDLNGDGYDDIIVGIQDIAAYGGNGAVYVVFGLTRE